jgi:malonyl-CoA/methylmalonyl-CoA synthetase
MKDSTGHLPLIARAEVHSARTAVIDAEGVFTYNRLLQASTCVASALLDGLDDLGEKRIPFLVTPGFPWVAVQWGIGRAGGVAVPLPLGSPTKELEYFIDDTQAAALVTDAAGGSGTWIAPALLG